MSMSWENRNQAAINPSSKIVEFLLEILRLGAHVSDASAAVASILTKQSNKDPRDSSWGTPIP